MLQEEIENKIETADALAVKLLQRFNYSLTSMRSTSHNLSEGNDAIFFLKEVLICKEAIHHIVGHFSFSPIEASEHN